MLALHCLATTERAAALAALLEHRADVPVAIGTCGQPTAQRTLITAQLFGVRGTLFVISPDGRIHQGRPDDLAGWLAGTQTGAPKTGEGGQ